MSAQLQYNATLTDRIDLSNTLAIMTIQPDVPEPTAFIPGQYVTIGLNNEVRPELGSVRRPLSIASPPSVRDRYELYIRYVNEPTSDNPLTHLLWKLQPGDRINVRTRAAGRFTVTHTVGEDDPRLRVLVAAGTGLAPFTSMVFHEAQDPTARLDQWAVLHAASYDHELGYAERLHALADHRGLHYVPSISRSSECPNWPWRCGRVEDFFLPTRIADTEQALGLQPGQLTPEHCVIYICGLTGTIANTVERLLPRGFVPDYKRLKVALEIDEAPSLFFEQYDSTPLFDTKDPAEVQRLRSLRPGR